MPKTDRRPKGNKGKYHGNSNQRDQVAHAPYAFVPLSSTVLFLDGPVSHDHPYKDGLCGRIDYALIAKTPLTVGGTQTKSDGKKPGTVHFATLGGKPVIPGSVLKGMLRNVLEIAMFSRMRAVDDRRFAMRDLSPAVKSLYLRRVKNFEVTGYIRWNSAKSCVEFLPCQSEPERITYKELYGRDSPPGDIGTKYGLASKRLKGFQQAGKQVVITGNIPKKNSEWLFAPPGDAVPLDDAVWRGFLAAHDERTDPQGNGSWLSYWRKRFDNGELVPVWAERTKDKVTGIGLTELPRLPGDHSVHDAIRARSEDHLKPGLDFAAALFGQEGEADADGRALASRVCFHIAKAVEPVELETSGPVILSSPKPSFYPNYLEQETDASGGKLKSTGSQYKTWIGKEPPVVRGWKRYPARGEAAIPELHEPEKSVSVQVNLEQVKAGSSFNGSISFHNLRPFEVGALIWAIQTGTHGLGTGKPFGFGQVEFSDINVAATHNDTKAQENVNSNDWYIKCFTGLMEKELSVGWEKSVQISTLRNTASHGPQEVPFLKQHGQLRYMSLQEHGQVKKKSAVLAPYGSAEPPGSEE